MATGLTRSAWLGAATGLTGLSLAVAALALTFADRNSPPPYVLAGLSEAWSVAAATAVQAAGAITLSVVAGVLLWKQPTNRVSWVVAATALVVALSVFASEYAVHGLVVDPGSLPLADTAAISGIFLTPLLLLCAFSLILLFPEGRLRSARWRVLLGVGAIVLGARLLVSFDTPYPLFPGLIARQLVPVTAPPALWPAGAAVSWAGDWLPWAQVALALVAAVAILLRLAASRGDLRLQLKWFAYAAALALLSTLLNFIYQLPLPSWFPFSDFTNSDTASAISQWGGLGQAFAGIVLLPAAIGLAMLRYRLYDIDIVISRTILYGGLAAFVAATYGIVITGLGSLLGQRTSFSPVLTLFAIALAAVLLEPVRSRLQRLANFLVYGRRATPYEVLSDFARSVATAESSEVLLPRMADMLRAGTGAPAVEVWVRLGSGLHRAAASPRVTRPSPLVDNLEDLRRRAGAAGAVAHVFYEDEQLGALVVAKDRGEPINATERRLLEDLASQAGLLFSRFRLIEELRESRSRIVAAQDLERQRIERNLHDGAQQRFVNALLALGTADVAGAMSSDRNELLASAAAEVRQGLAELRDMARGLHPRLLTESGLAAAVSGLADRTPVVTSLNLHLNRRYPEAVEATAYYVVAEALANAAKHSRASEVKVQIDQIGERLRIEVSDDGVGGADGRQGSGLLGLQDRVAASRGVLTIESPPGKGTTIRVELPCG